MAFRSRKVNLVINLDLYEHLKDGIFCVNKTKHITSAGTVDFIKEILSSVLDVKQPYKKLKAGHGGTLDSSATGVLGRLLKATSKFSQVLGTGSGCKRLSKLLSGNKTYEVIGKFGEATSTYNDVGRVTGRKTYDHIRRDDLIRCLEQFKGSVKQTPPLYSALKKDGSRISDLVRAGKMVTLEPREVNCYSIDLHNFELPTFSLKVSCGGGFYVRSLIHDIGLALGSYAHVRDLCRIQQGPFTLQDCLSLECLLPTHIISAVPFHKEKYENYWKIT